MQTMPTICLECIITNKHSFNSTESSLCFSPETTFPVECRTAEGLRRSKWRQRALRAVMITNAHYCDNYLLLRYFYIQTRMHNISWFAFIAFMGYVMQVLTDLLQSSIWFAFWNIILFRSGRHSEQMRQAFFFLIFYFQFRSISKRQQNSRSCPGVQYIEVT